MSATASQSSAVSTSHANAALNHNHNPLKSVSAVRHSHHSHRQQYRILDESARKRRSRHQLEQLERDNFHDDPHANLVMHKKAPKFEDTPKNGSVSGSASAAKRHALPRSRMCSFQALLDDDSKNNAPNYSSIASPSPDSNLNNNLVVKRYFCSVCGFLSPYTCVNCGMRYCSLTCLSTHRDTRCLKWTA